MFSDSTASGQGTYHELLLSYDKTDHFPNLPFYNLPTYLNANIKQVWEHCTEKDIWTTEEEITEELRTIYNEELPNLYYS